MPTEQKLILAFGEVLWDLMPSGAVLGGAPFNFAYRVNSLGDSGIVASRLGEDALGREAAETMKALGMATTQVQWDKEHATGTVAVSLDEAGNPSFVIAPEVAYDHIALTDALQALAAEADCLCLTSTCEKTATQPPPSPPLSNKPTS